MLLSARGLAPALSFGAARLLPASLKWPSSHQPAFSATCDPKRASFRRSLSTLFAQSRIADAVYFLVEAFILVNTVHTLFFQPSGDFDIAYWFHRQWVVLPGYVKHYKRPILILHFFAGILSLVGMRHQCGSQLKATETSGGGPASSSKTAVTTHKFLGYVILLNQVLIHSPTILMMNTFVVDYRLSRTAFYCMTFTATMKCACKTVTSARRRDMVTHRRAARTLYNYISTFTKGRIYMYLVLPAVPESWRIHHIFLSDVISVAVCARYSWARTAKLAAVFAAYGLLLEALPEAWSALTVAGVFYAALYA